MATHCSTKSLFNVFEESIKYWFNFYGLKNFDVLVVRKMLEDDREAEILVDTENCIAVVSLNTTWPYKVTEEAIKLTAFHEVSESLLDHLEELGKNRYVSSEQEFITARHKIIMILQNSFYQNKIELEKRIKELENELLKHKETVA